MLESSQRLAEQDPHLTECSPLGYLDTATQHGVVLALVSWDLRTESFPPVAWLPVYKPVSDSKKPLHETHLQDREVRILCRGLPSRAGNHAV